MSRTSSFTSLFTFNKITLKKDVKLKNDISEIRHHGQFAGQTDSVWTLSLEIDVIFQRVDQSTSSTFST